MDWTGALTTVSMDFKRYVALAVVSRNIQKIGQIKRDTERERLARQRERLRLRLAKARRLNFLTVFTSFTGKVCPKSCKMSDFAIFSTLSLRAYKCRFFKKTVTRHGVAVN